MTLEDIIARIEGRYVEEGECWLWTGATVQGGRPYLTIDYKRVAVRTLMARAKGIWRDGDVNPAKCGNPLCVNPEHAASMTKSKHMKILGKIGGSHPTRLVKIQVMGHPLKKLEDWQVIDIRTSSESVADAARRHGVSGALVSRVRLHKTRKHLNPFASLIR